MKSKYMITIMFLAFVGQVFSQDGPADKQYMLIVRSKVHPNLKSGMVQTNIEHWQQFISGLIKSGQLVTGYKPSEDGATIAGKKKKVGATTFMSDSEEISSVFIIKAASLGIAKEIALKCPVYELDGSVEIREVKASMK